MFDEYIKINKAEIPYRFETDIDGTIYTFEIHYNADYDFFTISLELNGEVLAVGEKIVYGVPLFLDIMDDRFPELPILPWDESGTVDVVNWATLGKTVFLYVLDPDELEVPDDGS